MCQDSEWWTAGFATPSHHLRLAEATGRTERREQTSCRSRQLWPDLEQGADGNHRSFGYAARCRGEVAKLGVEAEVFDGQQR